MMMIKFSTVLATVKDLAIMNDHSSKERTIIRNNCNLRLGKVSRIRKMKSIVFSLMTTYVLITSKNNYTSKDEGRYNFQGFKKRVLKEA